MGRAWSGIEFGFWVRCQALSLLVRRINWEGVHLFRTPRGSTVGPIT